MRPNVFFACEMVGNQLLMQMCIEKYAEGITPLDWYKKQKIIIEEISNLVNDAKLYHYDIGGVRERVYWTDKYVGLKIARPRSIRRPSYKEYQINTFNFTHVKNWIETKIRELSKAKTANQRHVNDGGSDVYDRRYPYHDDQLPVGPAASSNRGKDGYSAAYCREFIRRAAKSERDLAASTKEKAKLQEVIKKQQEEIRKWKERFYAGPAASSNRGKDSFGTSYCREFIRRAEKSERDLATSTKEKAKLQEAIKKQQEEIRKWKEEFYAEKRYCKAIVPKGRYRDRAYRNEYHDYYSFSNEAKDLRNSIKELESKVARKEREYDLIKNKYDVSRDEVTKLKAEAAAMIKKHDEGSSTKVLVSEYKRKNEKLEEEVKVAKTKITEVQSMLQTQQARCDKKTKQLRKAMEIIQDQRRLLLTNIGVAPPLRPKTA